MHCTLAEYFMWRLDEISTKDILDRPKLPTASTLKWTCHILTSKDDERVFRKKRAHSHNFSRFAARVMHANTSAPWTFLLLFLKGLRVTSDTAKKSKKILFFFALERGKVRELAANSRFLELKKGKKHFPHSRLEWHFLVRKWEHFLFLFFVFLISVDNLSSTNDMQKRSKLKPQVNVIVSYSLHKCFY